MCLFSIPLFLSPPHLSLAAAPYVKVYLLDNGACKAKKKTKIARKTLEPLYQQALLFEESPQGKILQVIKPWSCTMCVCACVFPWPNISLSPSTGNSLGRLRATGPQMLHGSCTDPIGGAGPLQHSDWLVQIVSSFLIGGPYLSLAYAAGVPDIPGQLRTS